MHVAQAPTIAELTARLSPSSMEDVVGAPSDDLGAHRYLHWEKLHRMPPPAGLSAEQWWLRLKLGRRDWWQPLPLEDRNGEPFGFTPSGPVHPALHRVDLRCAGTEREGGLPSWRADRERFLVDAWMEEAIRSSQLEGATTARDTAKELLRSGRRTRDRSEMLIADNYEGMRFMREKMAGPLIPE